jgi:hypothetical protein
MDMVEGSVTGVDPRFKNTKGIVLEHEMMVGFLVHGYLRADDER